MTPSNAATGTVRAPSRATSRATAWSPVTTTTTEKPTGCADGEWVTHEISRLTGMK